MIIFTQNIDLYQNWIKWDCTLKIVRDKTLQWAKTLEPVHLQSMCINCSTVNLPRIRRLSTQYRIWIYPASDKFVDNWLDESSHDALKFSILRLRAGGVLKIRNANISSWRNLNLHCQLPFQNYIYVLILHSVCWYYKLIAWCWMKWIWYFITMSYVNDWMSQWNA
jgi:hypothetical protein